MYRQQIKQDELTTLDWDKLLFDLTAAIEFFQKAGRPLYTRILLRSGRETISRIGADIQFNLRAPGLLDFLGSRLEKFSNVNRTTLAALKQQIRLGVEAGETIDDIAGRVKRVYSSSSSWRAMTIARTETVSSANMASLLGAMDTELVEFKKWITSRDEDVRSTPYSHVAAEGETVGLDDFFRATGELLKAPATGSIAANSINCRCVMTYITKDGEV